MNEIQELYQQLIIDHGSRPRNFICLPSADCEEQGYNPLCGDKITLYLKLSSLSSEEADSKENRTITQATFQGNGCAISMASASLMTEALVGLTLVQAETLFHHFHQLLTHKKEDDEVTEEQKAELGKLMALSGVKTFPMRIKCATLAWHTFMAALRHTDSVSSVSSCEHDHFKS